MDKSRANEPGAVGFQNINQFAAIGSPTAKAVLEQMATEAREARDLKEAIALSKSQTEANERQQKIAAVNFQIEEGLNAYEEFSKLAQTALNKAFLAMLELPAGVSPKYNLDHLKQVNMPTAFPKGLDERFSPFTTTQAFLENYFARGVHASGKIGHRG